MRWINTKLIGVALASVMLMSCSSSSLFKPVLETDGEEMIDIYRNATDDGGSIDEQLEHQAALPLSDDADDGVAVLDQSSLAQANKNRLYKNKSYTKWQGKFYNKKSGERITRFQCGLGGKQQTKPCGGSYGNIPSPKEARMAHKMADNPSIEEAVSKGPATAASIIQEQKNWEISRAREKAAVTAGFARTENIAVATPVAPRSLTAKQAANNECTRDDGIYCGFERTQHNEIQQLFPRLKNPDIVIFVTPHLATRNRVPVPGYTTVLPLYDQVHYAMPGEQVGHE